MNLTHRTKVTQTDACTSTEMSYLVICFRSSGQKRQVALAELELEMQKGVRLQLPGALNHPLCKEVVGRYRQWITPKRSHNGNTAVTQPNGWVNEKVGKRFKPFT